MATDLVLTSAMSKAAQAEFERCCSTHDQHDAFDDVVVAQGVTREHMQQAKDAYMPGYLRVALLPDHTLILDRIVYEDPNETIGYTGDQISKCAMKTEGLSLDQDVEVDYKAFGLRTHDMLVLHYDKPLVAFEILADGASIVRSLKMAVGYLRNSDTLERVVIFHCFPLTIEDGEDGEDGLWKIAALAMVFGLEEPTDRAASRIQLLAVESFGNEGVDAAVVDVLVAELTVPEVEPLSKDRGQSLLQPGLPFEIRKSDVDQETEWEEWRLQKLRISMGSFDDLVVDVVSVLLGAIRLFHGVRIIKAMEMESSCVRGTGEPMEW